MATLTTTVRDYCTLLVKSRLLPVEEVDRLQRHWKDEANGTDDQVELFRRLLVSKKHLTEYQSVMLQRGHADGFYLNDYKILDLIGKGQMGGVYKAVHKLGQMVALKILASSKARDAHILGRFQRESRLLTQLDHPNIVRAFQVGEADGVHYIVMELLEGETLESVLARRKKIPAGEAVRLMQQALYGLKHLHDRRMIHRDVKPSNMMLAPEVAPGKPDTTWDATLKLLDIGLGREIFDETARDEQMPTQLTVEGAVLGTPDYLAPEQAKDARSADERADLYSVGCVLYHCLTGRTPFPDGNLMTQMLKHATETPTPIATFAPNTPAGLQRVVDRLMAKDPERRFPSAGIAADALAPFLTPNVGVAPAPAAIVPAFKDWLATESAMELPQELQLPKPGTAVLPTVKPTPRPATLPRQRRSNDEVEVELVPPPPPIQLPAPPPQIIVQEPLPRALWQLDRRDAIMLGTGGLGVLAALGFGYAMAKLVRKKPVDE